MRGSELDANVHTFTPGHIRIVGMAGRIPPVIYIVFYLKFPQASTAESLVLNVQETGLNCKRTMKMPCGNRDALSEIPELCQEMQQKALCTRLQHCKEAGSLWTPSCHGLLSENVTRLPPQVSLAALRCSPRWSLPLLGPVEGWVCPCNSLLAAIMGVNWVIPAHSPAYLLTSSSGLSDEHFVPSPITRSKRTSWAQLPGVHLVFTCSLYAVLAESDRQATFHSSFARHPWPGQSC